MSKLGDFLKNNGAKVAGLAVKGGLGALMGGPAGAVAAIAKEIGLPGDSDEEAVLAAAQADPTIMAKIKEFEMTLDIKEIDANLKEREAELHTVREMYANDTSDRASARQMAMATPEDNTNKWLAFGAIGAFAAVVMMLVFVELQDSGKDLLFVAVGTLGTIVTQVYSFHFGSSSGSKEKSRQIGRELAEDEISGK